MFIDIGGAGRVVLTGRLRWVGGVAGRVVSGSLPAVGGAERVLLTGRWCRLTGRWHWVGGVDR